MKRRLTQAAIAAMILLSGGTMAQEAPPDATLALAGRQFALGLGVAWRGGTLNYRGNRYPVAINGLALCDIGVTAVEATAEIYDLIDLAAFDGSYVLTNVVTTLSTGTAITLRNEKGVVLRVRSATPGLRLKEAAAAVSLSITE